ncbi:hypothetical protein [Catenuloplanes atrovinosus]|uniref:Energy-coupling factor transporter transmembrane protein EcfT n=1 Tax=Catenuloplanes atrovinosus TaxID=137266 RepID=A0AAE3YRJ9_9ACTN|nr:hypothetical protein [Catenuloplanes atrovinosus]MDR7278569.1 energy-coupling factor transporter transmembrane protein EcfT [Catenuloplanes atrovinosus]
MTGVFARLSRLNPTGVFLATLLVVLLGLLIPGPAGGVILLVLAAAVTALAAAAWRVTSPSLRPVRIAMVALLIVAAIWKLG